MFLLVCRNNNPEWCEIHLLGFSPNNHKLECTLHMQERANHHSCRLYDAQPNVWFDGKQQTVQLQTRQNLPPLIAAGGMGSGFSWVLLSSWVGVNRAVCGYHTVRPWLCSHLVPAAWFSSDGKLHFIWLLPWGPSAALGPTWNCSFWDGV